MSPITAYLKLEFSYSSNYSKLQEDLIFQIFGQYFDVKLESSRIRISGELESPFFESVFKIDSKHGLEFDKKIVHLANKFTEIVRNHTQVPTLVLHSPQFFDKGLVPTLSNRVTRQVSFGNLHENQFFQHHQTIFGKDIGKISTDFVFDKSTTIIVDIWTRQKANYRLNIDGTSIYRLIVDFDRLFFVLKSPVRILEAYMVHGRRKPNYRRVFDEIRAENHVFCLEFGQHFDMYQLLSRLKNRWNVQIAFANICTVEPTRYLSWENELDRFLMQDFPYIFPEEKNFSRDEEVLIQKIKEKKFSYGYLITALISRGSVVKDQILLNYQSWNAFFDVIREHMNDDENYELCESALEDLLTHVDIQPHRVGNLTETFRLLCRNRRQLKTTNQLTKEQISDGFRRIRKVILTPTRKLFMIPETIMSNRALNEGDKDGTSIVKVALRDDNLQVLRNKEAILEHLNQGFEILGKEFGFLGASNSQMREGGAYFMRKSKIQQLRETLGNFDKLESISIVLARKGQCFTQAKACNSCKLGKDDFEMVPDVTNGKYTFSDGCSSISVGLATKLAKEMKLKYVPSAFQFRFKGMKGMLVVNPNLDRCDKKVMVQFRPSQLKFDCSTTNGEWPIELVKWSSPASVTLNRPFINILDQVSEIQSTESHLRIRNRIEQYLDLELESFSKALSDEKTCREKLEGMPRRVYIPALDEKLFELTNEPFFRSLIRPDIDVQLARLISKIQVRIPTEFGRTMFGVMDETGKLKYGQVFVKYSASMNTRSGRLAAGVTHTGRVLITKSPSTVAGDVRMLEAVDIPELSHLQDVVVFPQCGPRPHPNEMAGSDLDGDEYSVIWDPQLFLDRNEPAAEYSSEKPAQKFKKEEMDAKMHEFIAEFMENDNVGHIAVNHLHQSDQFGLNSKVCDKLAKMGSIALDYSKSGVSPGKLSQQERSERIPDFSSGNSGGVTSIPMYESSRLLGTLYRELKCVNDVVDQDQSEKQLDIQLDPLLTYPGSESENLMHQTQLALKNYNSQLQFIMDTYGVATESEVFSGCFRKIGNRISNREQDDMSKYNTEYIIQLKTTDLSKKFREEFFAPFGGFMKCTTSISTYEGDYETDNVLKRVCKNPSNRMMAKAVAYYQVCYESASTVKNPKLSFAWIAFDILNFVKNRNLRKLDVDLPLSSNLQLDTITSHRHSFIKNNQREFRDFVSKIFDKFQIIAKYVTKCPKSAEILFIIDNWGKSTGLLEEYSDPSQFQWYHLALLFLEFAEKQNHSENPDQLLLSFFKYLASLGFRQLTSLDLSEIGFPIILTGGLLLKLHKAGVRTYYNLILNQKFLEISGNNVDFGLPFVIELPKNANLKTVKKKLMEKSKCTDLEMRIDNDNNFNKNNRVDRLIISSRGTFESLQQLRELCTFKFPRNISQPDSRFSMEIAEIIYERIIFE